MDRILTLLRNKIREQGYTQLDVQAELGWGRSYISQLLTKQKALRVEQVLLILDVIGVQPADFYSELYRYPAPEPYAPAQPGQAPFNDSEIHDVVRPPVSKDFTEARRLLHGLVQLLLEKGVVTDEELTEAVASIPVDA
ncbi:MAG: helix-turn-helix transcriptional regulator [Acidobacteriota bacterium]